MIWCVQYDGRGMSMVQRDHSEGKCFSHGAGKERGGEKETFWLGLWEH